MKHKLMKLAIGHVRTIEPSIKISLAAAFWSTSALLAPGLALAQSQGEATTVLNELTVQAEQNAQGPDDTIVATSTATATKTDTEILDVSQSISVVTEEELETRGVRNLDEALSYTPGVTTDLYGSDNRYDHFMIRGFYEAGMGIYHDGLAQPIYVFTGSRLEPYGVQRLEVLKGSTSTLFGLNAPGGIVNAITKRPQPEEFGEIYTTLGDGHVETGTDFGGKLDESGEWTYRLTAKWQDADQGMDLTEDNRLYGAGAITWSPSADTSLTLMANYYNHDGSASESIPYGQGIDPDTYLSEPDFDNMDTEEANLGYEFRHNFGNGIEVRQNARYTGLNMTYQSVYPGSAPITTSRVAYAVEGRSDRFAIDNQLEYDTSWDHVDSRTLIGLDASYTDWSDTRYYGSAGGINPANPSYCGLGCVNAPWIGDNGVKETTTGIYAQEELTLNNTWILTFGGRYDYVYDDQIGVASAGTTTAQFTDEAFTKKIGLTNKLTDEISIYGNYSESFEPAFSYASYMTTTPNSKRGTQYELGVKYQPLGTNAMYTAALYDLTQTNVLIATSPTTYEQLGKINVRGLELEGKWAMSDRFNLGLAYAYMDAKIKEGDNAGNRPYLVPTHSASVWADYTIPGEGIRGDLTLGAGLRFLGSRFADDANTTEIEPSATVDLAVNYQINDATSLSLNVNNVFDTRYVTYLNTNNVAFYNDARSVLATLKYTW